MPYAAAAAAAAAIGGAVISSDSANSAANKQSAATDKAITATNAATSQSRADLAPYREAGTAALARLQSLMGIAPDKSQYLKGYSSATSAVDPNNFDAKGYLMANPDVASNAYFRDNPLAHYTQYGKNEGRQTYTPEYDTAAMNAAQQPGGDFGSLLKKFSSSDLAADPVYNSGLQFGLDEGTKAVARKAAAGGGYDSGAEDKAIARFANDYGSTKASDAYSRFTNDQSSVYGKLSGLAGMGSGATTVGVGAGTAGAANDSSLISGLGNAQGAASIAKSNAFSNAGNTASQYALLSQLSGGGGRNTSTYDPNFAQDAGASLQGSG